jgi:SAM-dependent MidA family methyltransferase
MTPAPPPDAHVLVVPSGWPRPADDDEARSRALTALIRGELDVAQGTLPFSRFMELVLYAPGLGYYSAAQPKFGAAGDYVTAPEISPLFGRALANQIVQVLDQLPTGDVLEVGAGAGTLAVQLLRALETLGRLPSRYLILEVSAGLRALQQRTLAEKAPQLLERVQWLEALPSSGFSGVVIGNELLDAMPVARFHLRGGEVFEQHVEWRDHGFAFCDRPARAPIAARIAPLALPDGYASEIGLHAEGWIRSVGAHLEQGAVLLLDYGFPQTEFYHPQRTQGTLMCHYRHRAHADPLLLVGLQDITAHVDFSAMAEAGHDAGLALYGYTSQAAFLIGCGITELAIEAMDLRPQLEQAQAIGKLTAPHEMGELVKAIALGKGLREALRGFVVQDRRNRL